MEPKMPPTHKDAVFFTPYENSMHQKKSSSKKEAVGHISFVKNDILLDISTKSKQEPEIQINNDKEIIDNLLDSYVHFNIKVSQPEKMVIKMKINE